MRISDWSSDVCSSDLRIEHLLAQRRSNTRAVVGDVDLDRPVVSGTQGDRHLGAVLDGIIDNVADPARQNTRSAGPCEPPRPLVGDSETGRAACRGRVCQYEEISGVAVIIKKKK